ncbi:putative glucan 1,3-beta-glucosidase [Microsporum ferrugineum]
MAQGLVSSLLLGQILLVLVGLFSPAAAVPTPQSQTPNPATQASNYWVSSIKRQGIAPFNGGGADYKVFRNVKDFGAKGDGSSDDTAAINTAISSGSRCGKGCDSSTTTPALVYFPPGTYVVSKPIIQYYYTQIVGDALNMPVIKAAPSFEGIAVIDSDPYENDGSNWYTNQNNFFRSIRNVVIDLTGLDRGKGAGIHWQVAQASSLQNIRFEMVRGGGDANKQLGIFMDNGSGGFMTDLVFNGGNYGAFFGNQQFTTRNLTFNNCNTAIFMNWNWAWTFKSLSVNDCGVALNMSNGGFNQTVGSVMILDSKIKNTPKGIVTSFNADSVPESGGTLILDNVDFSGSADAVSSLQGASILAGNSFVKHWVQGNAWTSGSGSRAKRQPSHAQARPNAARRAECPAPVPQQPAPSTAPPYPIPETSAGNEPTRVPSSEPSNVPTRVPTGGAPSGTSASIPSTPTPSTPPAGPASCPGAAVTKARVQSALPQPSKPAILLDSSGKVFERAKPQYENVPVSQFISVKSAGAKGDGKTDDTQAIQAVLDKATADQVVYFDHGAYLITSTIKVPKNIKITGEIWPMLMATGKAFSDMKNPIPMLQVGQPGDKGTVEMSDIIVTTKGPAPGCILVEWNVAEQTQGSVGMWDVHFRVGGFAGTELQSNTCAKTPNSKTTPDPKCFGAFMLLHITKTASAYLENTWLWVSDHELDLSDHGQINIYNGRGALIESSGAVWMYGTASEHNTLYNYQIQNAKNVYMALIQTETPYYQSNPDALVPFAPDSKYNDPTFGDCTTAACKKAWGLRILNSTDVFLFGGGLYSFFENYTQDCLRTESCQLNMIEVLCSQTYLYGVSTKASTNMITSGGKGLVPQKENRSNFCSTVALFHQGTL